MALQEMILSFISVIFVCITEKISKIFANPR